MTNAATTEPIDREEIRAQAADLLRELAQHVGDAAAVTTVLHQWLDDSEDVAQFRLIGLAALQIVFTSCLSIVPPADAPPGAVVHHPPKENQP